jgi:predicted nucleotidyltransferase
MPRPDPRKIATKESRAAGGRARAEKLRERREAAEETLEGVVDEAIECLVAEMRAKGPDRTRAAVHILDRVLGKSTQRLEGKLELRRADLLAEAREQLRREYADQVPAARAKLDRLIESRARRLADANGD